MLHLALLSQCAVGRRQVAFTKTPSCMEYLTASNSVFPDGLRFSPSTLHTALQLDLFCVELVVTSNLLLVQTVQSK